MSNLLRRPVDVVTERGLRPADPCTCPVRAVAWLLEQPVGPQQEQPRDREVEGLRGLEPGWTNRLFVATAGCWRGSFPLSGDVYWNPKDPAAPYALIFDPHHWTPMPPVPAPTFRSWRYLDTPPGKVPTVSVAPGEDPTSTGGVSPPSHP
jgi:hypothetical protein